MIINFTPAAEKFIRRLLKFDGGPGYGMRLLVTPGGCSGMSAEFGVEAKPRDGEAAFVHGDITLFLPAQSRLLLDGVTIDFAETPTSSGFKFIDPKQKTCGCSTVEAPESATA
jgi:iron-sulfur cluster assembly accessory protein